MKKALALLAVIALTFGILAATGCGGGEEAAEDFDFEEMDISGIIDPVVDDIFGVYVEGMEDSGASGPSVRLMIGETFEGDAWGQDTAGTFETTTEGGDFVVFEFEDGSTERWSVMIGDGRIHAIVSPEGEQYTRQK